MKIVVIIGLCITITGMLSCEKEVQVNIPYAGDKLVLNAFIRQDSLIYAQVSKTQKLSLNIQNAIPAGTVVQLFGNGNFIQNLVLKNINGSNYFTSTVKAIANGEYKLVASATNLTTADGQDILPKKPACTKLSYIIGTDKSKLQIKINDPAGIKNYYMIRLYNADTSLSPIGPRYLVDYTYPNRFSTDIAGTNTGFDLFGDEEQEEIVFADDQFNGKEITISLSFVNFNSSNFMAPQVVSLSKAAYNYLSSTNSQLINQGNPFAEVSVIYNNINNGYGIVAGSADSSLVIKKQ